MKTISGKIFTAKVSVERVQDDGLAKVVKENYALKAVNFTDCEAKLTKEVGSYDNVKESFDVVGEAIAPYKEIFLFDEGDIFYKVKVKEDNPDNPEKKFTKYYLVNADSLEQARKNIVEAFGSSVVDYTIADITEQKIVDVFE